MKVVAVSDIHGQPLKRLEEEVIIPLKPDLILCLGDFDQTKTIREVKELEKRYQMIVVPGNHEHSIYNGYEINSPALLAQRKDYDQLRQELFSDQVAKNYVKKLLANHKREIAIVPENFRYKYRTIVIHGALAGDLHSNRGAVGIEAELWNRLENSSDYDRNFQEM